MATYGKKGGIGATAGRKASVYEATLPDGTVLAKRSYNVSTPEAYIGYFWKQTSWYAAGVTEQPQDWGGAKFIKAHRVAK